MGLGRLGGRLAEVGKVVYLGVLRLGVLPALAQSAEGGLILPHWGFKPAESATEVAKPAIRVLARPLLGLRPSRLHRPLLKSWPLPSRTSLHMRVPLALALLSYRRGPIRPHHLIHVPSPVPH